MRKEVIGNATLYQGDCLEVMPLLTPGRADMVLTDPPYSSPVVTGFGRNVERDYHGGLSMQRTYLKLLAREFERLLPKRVMVFCDEDYYPVLHESLYHWPSRQMVIWDKGRIGLGNGFRKQHELIIHASLADGLELATWDGKGSHASILRFSPVDRDDREHGAQKPIDLISYLVKAGSTKTVLDPFMGSGTTGIACAAVGRDFIGIEIEPKYFDMACERLVNAQRQENLFA